MNNNSSKSTPKSQNSASWQEQTPSFNFYNTGMPALAQPPSRSDLSIKLDTHQREDSMLGMISPQAETNFLMPAQLSQQTRNNPAHRTPPLDQRQNHIFNSPP